MVPQIEVFKEKLIRKKPNLRLQVAVRQGNIGYLMQDAFVALVVNGRGKNPWLQSLPH